MNKYKINDEVFYNGRLRIVNRLNSIGQPDELIYGNSRTYGSLGEMFKMNDYEIVEDNDVLSSGDKVVLLELFYPLNQLNEGTLNNYKNIAFNKELTIEVYMNHFTLGTMTVNKDHRPVFAVKKYNNLGDAMNHVIKVSEQLYSNPKNIVKLLNEEFIEDILTIIEFIKDFDKLEDSE